MTRACHTAVRMATGDVFSDAEIDDLLNRMSDRARRAKAETPTASQRQALAEAAQALTREQLMASLIDKRLKIAADIARQGRRAKIDAMPDKMNGAERLNAFNVGSERQGLGTSSSVDAEARARQMSLWGPVQVGLDKQKGLIDRISNFWGVGEKDVDRKIAREMARINGAQGLEPTGDEGALHAARVFAKALDDAREMQNAQGAWTPKAEGYIARQSHDAAKVAGGLWRELAEVGREAKAKGLDVDWAAARLRAEARAFGAWRDFILPKLDPKTFDGLEHEDVPFTRWEDDAQEQRQLGRQRDLEAARALAARGVLKDPTDLRELMLHRVWMDIVTGRHAELSGADDLGDFRPSASLARSVSKARVLHFADPDAWVDYNAKYGRGTLFSAVMSQLERGARNAALMKAWGPAPEAAFEAEKTRLANEARAIGDAKSVKALDGSMVRARFEALNGRADTPDNMRLASTMRTIRGLEALTKLGSIVLSKATDLPMTGHTMARAGAGFLRGYGAFFGGVLRLGSEDAKRAADALDVGARSFASHLTAPYLASDGLPGWTSWATRLMYRINGFEWFNEGVRKGAAETYSRFLGQEAEHGWDALQQGTRETMERFGIGPADWEAARHGLEPAPDGRTYFTLDHLDQRSSSPQGASARINGDLKLKFATMIHNVIDDTVSEPRARERAGINRGTRAGTVWGEIARSFMQFKGFVNAIVGRHLIPAANGYAGYKPVALMAHFIIGSALAGWVSMNAKLIARGEVPKGLIGGDLGDTAKIWGAAMAQGGGLGLYGDFLFGEQARNGASFDWGSLGGPMISDSEQVAKLVMQVVHGGAVSTRTGRSQIPGELLHLGSQNIPLVNLWYTRLALDYLVLWRLQEAASPGFLQRYEERARTQQGATFFVHPTSAAH
ncbi:MAG TPA: hypothetical protein VMU59_09275 [Caulobacteraceae bacterium]|nr:hypothetical protein [Caulobacteraceae bacterium]